MAAIDSAALDELRRGFRGELLTTQDLGYEDARLVWNAMVDKRPTVIARCAGAEDVSAALRLARRSGLEVAVRGGGHSVSGNSSTDGGIVIDLTLMRTVTVDAGARTATVGGGALIRDLDTATQRFGLGTTGGMVSHTGVGGLTLGGGYGYLSRRFGLACDNLLSAEVVLADESIVVANASSEPELFWGLRGGGGNFGIVTSFEFRLHALEPTVFSAEFTFAQTMVRPSCERSAIWSSRAKTSSATPTRVGCREVGPGWTNR
jgi:FAD/FMN-containing dehydrogenase